MPPVITLPTGKRIEYARKPKKYVGVATHDIRRLLGQPLGFFGRERKKQERLTRVGELLGMMPERIARTVYQKALPFRLKEASSDSGEMVKAALPIGYKSPSKLVGALGFGALLGGSAWAYGRHKKRKERHRRLAESLYPYMKYYKEKERRKGASCDMSNMLKEAKDNIGAHIGMAKGEKDPKKILSHVKMIVKDPKSPVKSVDEAFKYYKIPKAGSEIYLPNGKTIEFKKEAIAPVIVAGLRFAAKPLARFLGGAAFRVGRTGVVGGRAFGLGAKRLAGPKSLAALGRKGMRYGGTKAPTWTSSPWTIGGAGLYMKGRKKRKRAEEAMKYSPYWRT